MLWLPTASVAIENVACPPLIEAGLEEPPSMEKFTVPVGVADPAAGVIVAVKITV